MQQMARTRLGWVGFLAAPAPVAAPSLTMGNVVGVGFSAKGTLAALDATPAKRIPIRLVQIGNQLTSTLFLPYGFPRVMK